MAFGGWTLSSSARWASGSVLYEKTSRQRSLVLRLRAPRVPCCGAEAFVGCRGVFREGCSPCPWHEAARCWDAFSTLIFAACWTGQKNKAFLFPDLLSFASSGSKLSFSAHFEKPPRSSNQAADKRILKTTKRGTENFRAEKHKQIHFPAQIYYGSGLFCWVWVNQKGIPPRFDSEQVLKITDRIKVSGAI